MQTITVTNYNDGIAKAKELLYQKVTKDTALFLSGGTTPKPLYEALAHEHTIHPRAVGLIDERYGESMHAHSNEKMIADTGLLSYLETISCPFYPMLTAKMSPKELILAYDRRLVALVMNIPNKIAIMGIGADGHIASIVPTREDFHNPMFDAKDITLVSEVSDLNGPFGERLTLTFDGLSLMDEFIILAFGNEKKTLLQMMMKKGEEMDVPARFFLRENISHKAILITDQNI